MTQKELIEKGVALFKQACFVAVRSTDANGTNWWCGSTCEGGGATLRHRMNEDTMTPVKVIFEIGHRRAMNDIRVIRTKAEEAANLAAIKYLRP